MNIKGVEGMSAHQIEFEIQRGGKFVFYQYCISIVVMTFRRPSDIYLVRAGESAVGKGLLFSLLTLLLGWWGIPWGPIYSVQCLVTNFGGGKDVTADIVARISPKAASASAGSK